MLRGLVAYRGLLVVGFILMVGGLVAGLYGPQYEAEAPDWALPKVLIDSKDRGLIKAASEAEIAWGRGLKRGKDGRFETAELALKEIPDREELFLAAGRAYERAVLRVEAEAAERRLHVKWLRIGATVGGIGVILTFLALGLGQRDVRRRLRALEPEADSAIAGSGSTVTSNTASSLSAGSNMLSSTPSFLRRRPRPVSPVLPAATPGVAEPTIPAADPDDALATTTEPIVRPRSADEPVVDPATAPRPWMITVEKVMPNGTTERVAIDGTDLSEANVAVGQEITVRVVSRTPEPGADNGSDAPTAT